MTPEKVYGTSKLEKKILENSWNCFMKMRQFEKKNDVKWPTLGATITII